MYSKQHQERDHSACGVGTIINGYQLPSRDLVIQALDMLNRLAYRGGVNPITKESDGVGITFYGLSKDFFQQYVNEPLKTEGFGVGQFFFAPEQIEARQREVEQAAAKQGLRVAGWRDLSTAIDPSVPAPKAQQKMPAMWQAILVSDTEELSEDKLLLMSKDVDYAISLSSKSITYKGELEAHQLQAFYKDLQDPLFTAKAATVHTRFATNTSPSWDKAQPFRLLAHNGEINSIGANGEELIEQMRDHGFTGHNPQSSESDSKRMNRDLEYQMLMHQITFVEAFVRLVPPHISQKLSPEIQAMLHYFALERTPYNGPAFISASFNGEYIGALDAMGLRPAHWAKTKSGQWIIASDAFWPVNSVEAQGHLEAGGILHIDTDGNMKRTEEVLEQIAASYHQQHQRTDYFQHKLHNHVLKTQPVTAHEITKTSSHGELNRLLFASGWTYESLFDEVYYMAENGSEQTAAMGDDTDPLFFRKILSHCIQLFRQLFAQVSAPPLDSIKERDRFSLTTYLGASPDRAATKQIKVDSPILRIQELSQLEDKPETFVLDSTYEMATELPEDALRAAIKNLLHQVQQALSQTPCPSILVLSDKEANQQRLAIPDVIATAAIRQYLKHKGLSRQVSLVCDSYQIHNPHHIATLVALGADAVYPRGAYEAIQTASNHTAPDSESMLHEETTILRLCDQFAKALDKALLKSMGKVGITHVANFKGMIGALGLDLNPVNEELEQFPTLANIFPGIISPMRGIQLKQIAEAWAHHHNEAYNLEHDFTLLPRSGEFLNTKNGVPHGFNIAAVQIRAAEQSELTRDRLLRIHRVLQQKGYPDFLSAQEYEQLSRGHLDSAQKTQGIYPKDVLNQTVIPQEWLKAFATIDEFDHTNPTALHHYLHLKTVDHVPQPEDSIQSIADILHHLYSGGMSQGALTVAKPGSNKMGAHETIVRALNAIGAHSASGEGGESPDDLQDPAKSAHVKQVASGRLYVTLKYLNNAIEIEIKMAQGAKPGEGGEMPGPKIDERFASQRGSWPGLGLISPPPHHDIYSIEDLQQLIFNLRKANPQAQIGVKIVATPGIGTIAAGVAKAGADIINIAGQSGGTGAASPTGIKDSGYPMELGLAEVEQALRDASLRDLVQLRASSSFKTPKDIIKAAILGAELFELGTVAMIAGGCDMLRRCNKKCTPGVATDGHLYKGSQLSVERYFTYLAAGVQQELKRLGVKSLRDLRDRMDLLEVSDKEVKDTFDFNALLHRKSHETTAPSTIEQVRAERLHHLNVQDGNGKQSPCAFMDQGKVVLTDNVQDGLAKSMSGGIIVVQSQPGCPQTLVGNSALYGARQGQAYLNARTGSRCGILMKTGMETVVHSVGDYAFEYMTGGTAVVLGHFGEGLANGASAGIIFAYDPHNHIKETESLRVLDASSEQEFATYQNALNSLLADYQTHTKDITADRLDRSQFKILMPKSMYQVNTLDYLVSLLHSYELGNTPLTRGVQVWLQNRLVELLHVTDKITQNNAELIRLSEKYFDARTHQILCTQLKKPVIPTRDIEDLATSHKPKVTQQTPMKQRLQRGTLDETIRDVIEHLADYVSELTQDAANCSGCNAQSCSGGKEHDDAGCPAGKEINTINTLLKRVGSIKGKLSLTQWKRLRDAFEAQIKETPFISYTGAACPAPCQPGCTEDIPDTGKPVPIKHIEWYLHLLGESLGWYDGKAPDRLAELMPDDKERKAYQRAMSQFKPAFAKPHSVRKEVPQLIIIGSGPAAMQLAYRALRDGIRVIMHEKSDQFGGLLADGIPFHKFDKSIIETHKRHLLNMGLQLHLQSEIHFDGTGYRNQHNQLIAIAQDHVAWCVGRSIANDLPASLTKPLGHSARKKVVQAAEFLKRCNDFDRALKENPNANRDVLRKHYLGDLDPTGKKILVIGGGDTAQDVVRQSLREHVSSLNAVARGPQPGEKALRPENRLKQEELQEVGGQEHFMETPTRIEEHEEKLQVRFRKAHLRHSEAIHRDAELKKLMEQIPRAQRPTDEGEEKSYEVDLVILALGFKTPSQIPPNAHIAGDAAGADTIIKAQASANTVYDKEIKKAMGIDISSPAPMFFARKQKAEQAPDTRLNVAPGLSS